MPTNYDVAVVGSGPAGAVTAKRLAGRGFSVAIIEKEMLPRYKTCGGGVLRRAAALLNVDLSTVIERDCRVVQLNISNKLKFEARRDEPVISMVMRDAFDHLLIQRAVTSGAVLFSSRRVTGIKRENESIGLETDQGPLTVRYLIAADGASGNVAKFSGWEDGRTFAPAMECEVRVSPEVFARFSSAARFDFGGVPFGYAWVFPKGEHLSVGVLTLRPARMNLNVAFQKYLERLSISPLSIERHGFIIPLSPRTGAMARDRVFLTGDAAGFADPITAEGITNAICSGQAAADAIAAALHDGRCAENVYNQWVAETIRPEFEVASRLAKYLYGSPFLRSAAFRWRGQRLVDAMMRVMAGETTCRDLSATGRSGALFRRVCRSKVSK